MIRKIKFIGRLIHYNDFLNNMFERRIMGRRSRGRCRTNNFQDIEEKMDCASYQQLEEAAKDRYT